QVGMVQVTGGPSPNGGWQKYIYGMNAGTPPDVTRATNLRGVSVWCGDSVEDTRVVVCGETFDQELPLSQAGNLGALASGANANGFIMVFDGTGELLWSHHF